ncbi:DNA glycosylase AlkZ-like family protein [Kitasatospora sp. LaBMicrA B282]|uniref:DNA glycosylase AlkZ-like family protein n=1 Tax=Kitasatospora sp. LaBMicrA B282 TaxID=3420949 RepID=UPI003D12D6AA
MAIPEIDRATARRLAVRAQLLDGGPPAAGLLPVVRHLTLLQLDPTAVIAPNADLVAWTRLGAAYRPEQLQQALEQDRTLFEYRAMVRPMADLPLFLPEMAAWSAPGADRRAKYTDWLRANDGFRRYVLDLLRERGPLPSREIEDRSVVPWPSTGWTNNRNVTQLLEFLAARGEIAISGRSGRQRCWDLAERVYPTVPVHPDRPEGPAEQAQREQARAEAHRLRQERTLRSLGIARGPAVGEAGQPVRVTDTRGDWRVDGELLERLAERPFEGRTALLSPFDRLIHDRRRMAELFEFEYKLEMYVPRADRRWGHFALPVLHADRLVGKVDAAADHRAKLLRVHAVHEDEPFGRTLRSAVRAELASLAGWLGLTGVSGW